MKRREFVVGLSAVPLAAWAQQPRPTIGFLNSGSQATFGAELAAFKHGLSEMGWTEGSNASIEFAWAEGNFERLPALAAELIRRDVSVIFANSVAARAAKIATTKIPLVFTSANDPVEDGLVTNINRPGGNVTGISLYYGELGPKRLELLQELVPKARIVGIVLNPSNPSSNSYLAAVQRAVRTRGGIDLQVLEARNNVELQSAFLALKQRGADALLVAPDPFFGRSSLPVDLARQHAIPTIYTTREAVASGGLASYGTSLKGAYRQAGNYVGRILKGESPADLPVLQPTKFELAINLKTAKALGIALSLTLQAQADEVIE